jgi:aminopeptidase YwaD
MNRRKLVSIVLSIMIATTIVPIFGSAATTQGLPTPPGPAYAPTPTYTSPTTPSKHQIDFTAATMSDVVVSMLEQADVTQFLSYEENITSLGPHPTGSSACIAAAAYIHSQFENMSLPTRYCHWNNGGYSSDNVEATINGTNDTSNQIFIICAHYDTVSAGPGADDDTSGTAAVLMTALIMSQYQFDHTLKFVTFSGEEEGLLGSEIYAQQAKQAGWDIIGVLNCDMISYAITTNDGNNLIVYINTPSQWLYTYTNNVEAMYNDYIQLTLHSSTTPPGGSDHESFWIQGYDAIFYFEYTMTPYYHTSQDTMAHINASYAVKNIRLAIATLAELAVASYKSNPPKTPALTGPTYCVINVDYSYTFSTTDPDGDDIFYYIDWGDGSNSGWLGPFSSGQTGTAVKSWTLAGTYNAKAKAKDINGVQSEWSDSLVVTVVTDRPPSTPTITGPDQGKPGTPYLFTFTSVDPDGDPVFYWVEWGDNTTSGWVGPFSSGSTAAISHTYDNKGTFTVRAKAKDTYDVESGWGTFQVKMPNSLILDHGPLFASLERFFAQHPYVFPRLQHLLGF